MKAIVLSALIQIIKDMKGEDLLQLNEAVQSELKRRGELPNGLRT